MYKKEDKYFFYFHMNFIFRVEKFTMVGVEVKGVLVCDKNGLPLASKDVSISPGPIARLTELATSLLGRRTTVCLEHNEA